MSLEILLRDTEDNKLYRFDGTSEGSGVVYLERLDSTLSPTEEYDSFLTAEVLKALTELTDYFVLENDGKFNLFELLIYFRTMRRFQKEEYLDCSRSPELSTWESKLDKAVHKILARFDIDEKLDEKEAIA